MVARCGLVRVQRRAASERVSEESASHCRSSVWKADAQRKSERSEKPNPTNLLLRCGWMNRFSVNDSGLLLYHHIPRTKKIDVAVLNATGDAEFQEC